MGNDSSFQAFFLSNVVRLLLGEVDNNAEQHLDQLDLVLHGGEPVGPEGRVELKMSSDFFYINKRMTSWSFKHFCCQNVAIMCFCRQIHESARIGVGAKPILAMPGF